MLRRTVLPGLILLLAFTVLDSSSGLRAGSNGLIPPAPPPPPEYEALVRFHIEGPRNERVLAFRTMKRQLEESGFREDPEDPVDPQDPRVTTIRGTVPSAKARDLLHQRYVQTIRLQPKDYMPPADKKQLVRVHIDLNAGVSRDRARQFHEDVRRVLAPLGFLEAAGYDNRGFTRLVGIAPAGEVDGLVRDLRRIPAGWTLLPPTLLADLRASPGGPAVLTEILDDWYGDAEGRKIVQKALALWRISPAGTQLLRLLPAEVVGSDQTVDRITVDYKLLSSMASNPESDETLRQLFTEVLQSKSNQQLMDLLLRRSSHNLLTLNLPLFYRVMPAVRVVEVLPTMPQPTPRQAPPAIPAGQEKITPDLRELLNDPAQAKERRRLEVILAATPAASDRTWEELLRQTVANLDVEGILGPMATVQTETSEALKLAALPEVVTVRLPRVARSQLQGDPGKARVNFEPLKKRSLEQLHLTGRQGQATRVAVIDSDFRGWESLRGKGLPAKTQLIDLTAERNYEMLPDPKAGPPQELGHGTRYARALMQAVPSVDLTLIRIDPGAPYQVMTVALAVAGDAPRSLNMDNRLHDLERDRHKLRLLKEQLLEERRKVLDDFGVDDETMKRRQDYFRRQADFERVEQQYTERAKRFFTLQQQIRGLKDVRIVASGLVWTEGYPVDGTSTLSRWFDDRPFRRALWFQAAGDTRGQAWSDLFRDEEGNGAMEFVPLAGRIPADAWSRELNFLAWQPVGEPVSRELPAGATLRITLQWREAHDPSFFRSGEDPFRRPLADFRIVLLRQPDPWGEKQPADDLEVVAETVGLPQRLERNRNSGIYEHVLQLKVPSAGRYAVRIEGKAPESTRPAEAPTLPAARTTSEVRPRLFVETLGGPGRAVWHSFATEAGSLGMPADSLRVLPIGSAEKQAGSGEVAPRKQETPLRLDK